MPFISGDTIDLEHFNLANHLLFANGTLDLQHTSGTGTVTEATLKFNGSYTTAEFVMSSDQHGGTLITLKS